MEKGEIFEILKSIIGKINSNSKIEYSTALIGESVLDSLEFMNYLTKVEESFKVKISDSDVSSKSLGVVENMVNHISFKISEKG